MRARVPVIAFRLLVLVGVWFLGTSTLSLAQESGQSAAEQTTATDQASASGTPDTLVVPDVRNLPYVFAKGVLEDAGFAWRVEGNVDGYAVNLVSEQSAKPGTRVVDTGAPTVVLHLKKNPDYEEAGLPDDSSTYSGTKLVLAKGGTPKPATTSDGESGQAGDPGATDTTPTDTTATDGAATDTAPAETQPETLTDPGVVPAAQTTSQVDSAPATTSSTSSGGSSTGRSSSTSDAGAAGAATRPPAFDVAGAPDEPLDEMPLTQRALALQSWLRKQTTMNANSWAHYDYQHAWVVTGAKFGWWHGLQALQTLLRVDQQLQQRFPSGAHYATETRAAIAEVAKKTKSA